MAGGRQGRPQAAADRVVADDNNVPQNSVAPFNHGLGAVEPEPPVEPEPEPEVDLGAEQPPNMPSVAERKGMRAHDDHGNVRPADGRWDLHRPKDESKYVTDEQSE